MSCLTECLVKVNLICEDKYIIKEVSSKNFCRLKIMNITEDNIAKAENDKKYYYELLNDDDKLLDILKEPFKTQLLERKRSEDAILGDGSLHNLENVLDLNSENIFFASTKKEYNIFYKSEGILICLKNAVDISLGSRYQTIIVNNYAEALTAIYCMYFYFNSSYIFPYTFGDNAPSDTGFIADIVKMNIVGSGKHRTVFWIYKNPEEPEELFLTYFFLSGREDISELTDYELYKYAIKESDDYVNHNYSKIPEENSLMFWFATFELNKILNDPNDASLIK